MGGVIVITALLGAACSRGSGLGPAEAVEILVLDGLARAEAICLVDEIGDDLDLAEVTGVEGDLDSEELMVLFEASRSCQPTAGASGGIVSRSFDELSELDDLELVEDIDVEGVVAELLRGGLDPELAVCVATVLLTAIDPLIAVSDETRKIDAILACDAG